MLKVKELFAPKDLTEGTPWIRIAEFSIPMLLGNIAQQFYNTADSIIVGKYIGDNALAAVGSAMPVLNLLLVLFVGISVGAGIMVSQYYGAKNNEKLSTTIGTCLTLTFLTSLIIMLIGPLVTKPLLRLLNTPASIIDWCADYLTIFFLGAFGFAFYNILTGILRGLGDSFSALIYLLISTVLNVILDIWFVAGLGMGVPGVALATVIAQGVSALLCVFKLLKMQDLFELSWDLLKPNRQDSLALIKLGLPSGLTQAIFSLAMIMVQSLTNSFGELVIACNVIVMRVDGFAMMPNFTFGSAMTTFTGQNIGAKRMDRVEKGTIDGTKMAVAVSTVITILILVFGRYLIGIFTDTTELIDLSMRMMRILAFGYIAMAITQCLSGVMRGAGDTLTPMWISIVITVFLRVPIAYGLAYLTRSELYPTGRPESTFISLLVSWTLGAVITTIYYRKGRWRKHSLAT
ncbi:MAG: MATE family efflux transporter [Firmicutes bacterium]|nr:MATE family efflux transporter [Bacillota bacterium]